MIITENSNSFFRIIPCTRCATLTLNAFVPIPCKGSISWAWNNRRKCCKWSKRVACSPLRSQSFAITRNRVPTLLKHDGWAVGRRDEVWGRFARRRRRLSARRVVTDDVSLRRWYREQRGCHVLYPTGERESSVETPGNSLPLPLSQIRTRLVRPWPASCTWKVFIILARTSQSTGLNEVNERRLYYHSTRCYGTNKYIGFSLSF